MNGDTVENLWQLRDKFRAMLKAAPPEIQPGLRVSVHGAETVLRAVIENRGGIEISGQRLSLEIEGWDSR